MSLTDILLAVLGACLLAWCVWLVISASGIGRHQREERPERRSDASITASQSPSPAEAGSGKPEQRSGEQ